MKLFHSPHSSWTGARAARILSFVPVVSFVVATSAWAQATAPMSGYRTVPGQPASSVPTMLREVGYDQHLNAELPLDATFRDENGRTVPLRAYFGSRPVIVNFVYYECPMLCTQVLNGLASTLSVLSLDAGKDFEVVTISIDPRETPALASAKKASYMQRYRRPTAAAGWHFLTGDEPQIKQVTKAAGFRYVWDDSLKQFAHPTGVIVATADGHIARYLFGIEYGPRDLRFGLIDASQGKIGNPVDAVVLYCFHYDPMTGKYGFIVMRAVRIAGAATVLALGTFIFVMVRREKRQQAPASSTKPGSTLADEVARAAAVSRQGLPSKGDAQPPADPRRSTF